MSIQTDTRVVDLPRSITALPKFVCLQHEVGNVTLVEAVQQTPTFQREN